MASQDGKKSKKGGGALSKMKSIFKKDSKKKDKGDQSQQNN